MRGKDDRGSLATLLILAIGMACMGLVFGFLVGQSRAKKAMAEAEKELSSQDLAVPVEVAPCTREPMVLSYFGTGALESPNTVMVFPKIPGEVKRVHAEEGQTVQEGDPLVTLDDEEVRILVEQARASLAGAEAQFKRLTMPPRSELVQKAKAGLQQAKEALDVATSAFERSKGLREADMIPEMQFEKARAEYAGASSALEMAQKDFDVLMSGPTKEEIEAAKSQVEAARKGLELAELKLQNVVITAPISGMLLSFQVVEGEMMLEKLSKPIVVAGLNPLRVKMNVPERQMNLIRVGQEVEISVDALKDEVFKGPVSSISPMVDLKNGTVAVEVTVENPDQRLRPGMFCRLNVVLETHSDALTIPKQAITQTRDQKQVFVVKEGIASLRNIQTGLEDEMRAEVQTGIEEGELVIVVGQNTIRDGSEVRIVVSRSSAS